MYYASICTIAKDEDQDIHEWLFYHFVIGFEHILVYDNNSQLPLRTTLSEFIKAGLVTVIDLPLNDGQQLSAYIHALRNWGHNTTWLAFIDIDEFILPIKNDDIRDFLDNYTSYAGVCANWCTFSSNGHIGRPAGGILENYTDCLGLDPHIKSIVQPRLTKLAKSAHHFIYKDGNFCVNEDEVPVRDFHTYPLANKICINHYYYKSQEDFHAKIARGFVTKMQTASERKIDTFYKHLKLAGFRNDSILRFKPKLDKFSHYPMTAVADFVRSDSAKNLDQGLMKINAALEAGQIKKATSIYKVLRRYHQGIALDIVGANLAFLQGKHEVGIEILRSRMTNDEICDEDLRLCYLALGNHYELVSKPEVRDIIKLYLN